MDLIYLERQRQMFGCTEQELKSNIDFELRYIDYITMAISVLRGAEYAMDRKDYEWARQEINCAKWVLSHYRVRN